ncbi:hypothetical protein, partial [Myxosarcina sp. GI1]|uniref:hypothetical protein n=1 Tax=Myxosarcina sp. GI1 TaxID=1541065 RepID=UPI0012E0BC9E
MNILSNFGLSSNLHNNNHPTSGRSSKANPCPVCDKTNGKCKFTDTGILCFYVSNFSIGEEINGYRLNVLNGGNMGGALSPVREKPSYQRKVTAAKKTKKPTKCETAKPDRPQHSKNLWSLVKQLPPTRKAVDFLNERFHEKQNAKHWQSLGFFSAPSKEVKLSKPVSATIAGVKATDPKRESKDFYSSYGNAVNIPIFNVYGDLIGHQPMNFKSKEDEDTPKYSWNTWSYRGSKINDAKVKLQDGSLEFPLQVIQTVNSDKTIYICEGSLKPMLAAVIHDKTVVGSAFDLSLYPRQLRETLAVLNPDRVIITPDAGAIANQRVFDGRIDKDINELISVRNELKANFEIFIADWGQLWSKEGLGDIDEVNKPIVNRSTLIPVRDWMLLESRNVWENYPLAITTTNIYNRDNLLSDKKPYINSLKVLRSNTLAPVNPDTNPSTLQALIENSELSQVFHRFTLKEKLSSAECAAIASSLAYLKGGETFYKNHLHEDYLTSQGSNSNVKNFCKVLRRIGFNPCVMPDVDYSLYDIAKGRNILRLELPQTVTLEASRDKLNEAIVTALQKDSNGVITITVSTGVGKTHNLAQAEFYKFLESHNINVVILFATHKLLQEFQQAVQYPVLAQVELHLPDAPVLRKTINELYQFNMGREANDLLYKCIAHNPLPSNPCGTEDLIKNELTDAVKQHIRQYLDAKDQIRGGSTQRVILATHAFFSLCPEAFEGRTVIADEDLSKSYLRVSSSTLNELASVASGCQPDLYGKIWNRLVASEDNQAVDVSDITNNLNPETLLAYFEHRSRIEFSSRYKSEIPKLLAASHLVKNGKKFSIIQPSLHLPDNKIIILSATPNKAILKQLAGDRLELINVGDTELKGNLYQITDRSYSRSCLKELDVNELRELTGNRLVITTIANKKKFNNPSKTIHFGNCLGYNELKGQDIDIVGFNQPSPANIISMFIACGGNTESKDLRFKNQIVRYNGC